MLFILCKEKMTGVASVLKGRYGPSDRSLSGRPSDLFSVEDGVFFLSRDSSVKHLRRFQPERGLRHFVSKTSPYDAENNVPYTIGPDDLVLTGQRRGRVEASLAGQRYFFRIRDQKISSPPSSSSAWSRLMFMMVPSKSPNSKWPSSNFLLMSE